MSAEYGGRISAMPVVSYASISDKPPLVAVACSPFGFTCKLALRAKAFSLSILDRTHREAISSLATVSGMKVNDKLKAAGLDHTSGKSLKVPVIRDSLATLECKLGSKRKFGDHLLLVGEVRAAYASEAFTDFWDFSRYRPLLYSGWREGLTTYPDTSRTTE